MLLKMIIVFALACFAALFLGGLWEAQTTEVVKKVLFGGASIAMISIAIGIIFVNQ